jgi:hypothetical protein
MIRIIAAAPATITINNSDTSILAVMVRVLNQYLPFFAGTIAVGSIVYAGVLFMTSAGNPDKMAQAKRALFYSVIAIIIFTLSFGIIKWVNTFATATP